MRDATGSRCTGVLQLTVPSSRPPLPLLANADLLLTPFICGYSQWMRTLLIALWQASLRLESSCTAASTIHQPRLCRQNIQSTARRASFWPPQFFGHSGSCCMLGSGARLVTCGMQLKCKSCCASTCSAAKKVCQ